MGFQLSTFPFEILRRVALWRAQYDESCKLCSGGSYCLSLASMVESVGGLRGGSLPCGGCQRTLGDGIALNKVKGEVQTRKGLRWIPRHPETRKGVVSDEMLRGVENKRRSGDSRIGKVLVDSSPEMA
ncbi:PREDICTED: ZemaCp157 [Prunus dulcis]|uniref:PREDICTED: ZemaCp157 (Chloroplast) n=1 Tax=Prunus dulcis TaxID=3755 RepID=A0A5E4EZA3_PRUDU|nr:PREDICTED: ZemaCp157 [Prunus dulcis]